MKNTNLFKSLLVIAIIFQSVISFSQAKKEAPWFDRKTAEKDAIAKGIPEGDLEGYLFALEREFYAKQQAPANPTDPNGIYTMAKEAIQLFKVRVVRTPALKLEVLVTGMVAQGMHKPVVQLVP